VKNFESKDNASREKNKMNEKKMESIKNNSKFAANTYRSKINVRSLR
jgi:hypothetical protein